MKKILAQLNKVRSIRGSLLVTRDGIIIASDLEVDTPAETVGAVSSEVLLAIENTASRTGLGAFRRFTVSGRDGRCVAVPVSNTLLLVLVEADANLAMVWVEIREAAKQLEGKLRIT